MPERMTEDPIPYGRQSIGEDDIQAVVDVLRSDRLTTGPAVTAFEEALGNRVQAPHVVAVSNGTAALQLVYAALGLGPGDQIIVPAVTFLASASAAALLGCEIVLADVDPDSGLLTAQTLEAALELAPTAKAVTAVHLAGQSCRMEELAAICESNALWLVEDACHALGATQKNKEGQERPVGSCPYSAAACFSFHPVKTIAMGEGGAVTLKNRELADRIHLLRNHGMVRNADLPEPERDHRGRVLPWFYRMAEPGWNYRITDIQCALGLSQLRKLDSFISERQRLADRYDAAFSALGKVCRPITREETGTPAWHLYALLCEGGEQVKSDLFHHLMRRKIIPQVHYIPLYYHEHYARHVPANAYPGAQRYYEREISLPLYVGLTDAQQEHVIESVKEFFWDL